MRMLQQYGSRFRFQDEPLSLEGGTPDLSEEPRAWAASDARARYIVVLFTDVSTIVSGLNLRGGVWGADAASGQPLFEIKPNPLPEPPLWCIQASANVARRPTKEEVARMRIGNFLEDVYKLAEINDLDGATDRIFDFMDRLLCDGLFGVCDEVLRTVDVARLPTALMRSFLSITSAAKQKLPSRVALYRKTEKKMVELKGVEKTQRIIGKLA